MNKEIIGNYLLINGKEESAKDNEIFSKLDKAPIYEVFTVEDSCAMFVESHMERLERTAKSLNEKLGRDENQIAKDLKKLIKLNSIERSNIKLLRANIDEREYYIIYEMTAKYPESKFKRDGIKAVFYDFDRKNPNIKIHLTDFKRDVANFIESQNAFEAVLRRTDGGLPEGSRTNAYFIKDETVYTSPGEEVLRGITRALVLKLLKDLGIEVKYQTIDYSEYEKMDGMFFSGTTIDIMPVRELNGKIYNSQDLDIVKKVVKGYEDMKKNYIKEHK
ncbi:MAG: aminotransferase class IV [Tissierellia bacterium]|nr:aminotransferase class IV [Tissierellia bacterium]